ncbi:MAG: ATPase, T2SS/T4P/T4SS family [Fusobacterium gastrosuis]|uniref:ATPase, T2SS/T4P/T4SS family n=1 Tax=Fusobacterium gastrosuis TaxID=1755100 RepID=UPI0029748410|nr:ATPase, T2SS/T4P/T4SS family [Fusobacteriaceae bacterium]MDY4011033.1 ATPase, T2SS/T4P/T4SS family [Fusobacterium gastrosuis]MDY5714135.1 ATPase, T2SS/T4P/T4SS family [Fusobacterium gastrosuis]
MKELKIFEYFFDDSVTEIMINTDNSIFIKKAGVGSVNTNNFASPEKTLHIIQILASLEGLIINSSNPRISTTLPMIDKDNPEKIKNYRFEGLVPPVVENPIFNIRKPTIKLLTLEDYIAQGAFTRREADLLKGYIKDKKNMLVIGATDTGKTTLINALVREMKNERLVFIEEVRELQVDKTITDNVSFLQVIKGCFEPKDAIRSGLRMSPERFIYGEVRGAEAYDFLMAFNTGHKGGICSIHSNDCYSGMEQLEIYTMLDKDKVNPKFIARTVEVLVNMVSVNNKRILEAIAEVRGYENGHYILDFKYQRKHEEE